MPSGIQAADDEKGNTLLPNMSELYRRPGFLQAAAKASGHFSMSGEQELPWVDTNLALAELVKLSDLIVVAQIQTVRSYTVELGRYIESECKLTVGQTI